MESAAPPSAIDAGHVAAPLTVTGDATTIECDRAAFGVSSSMLLCVAVAAAATVAPTAALTHLPVPAAAARMDVYQALLTGARDEQIDRVMSHATKALAAQSCSIGRGDTTTFLIEAYAQAISGPATANFSRVLVGLDAHAHCVLDSTNQGAIVSQAKEMEFALHTLATLTEIVAGRRPGFEPGVPASAAQLTRYHAAIAATADRVIEFVHERGPFNRGACLGAGLAEAARVLPNAPNRSAWVAFSRLSWDDWRSVNDTFEDSSGYNSLWARCSWLQGAAFLQADPPDADEYTDGLGSLHALFERWAVQSIDGVGPLPAWGASTFADLSWTANFEYGASHGDRNGWFAEIATRMTSFVQQINHTRPPSAWTATPYHDYWGVDEGFAYAWEQANCSTPRTAELSGSAPAPQLHVPLPSRVLSRHNWPHGEQLFDKAVLRGGGDASNFVLLQLFDRGYHGMPDGGAVLSLASGGSQLIHGLGYTCDPADRHSRLLVRADDEAFIRPSPQVKDQHNWETPFRPGVSYRWVVSPRRYGNHMSTVFNDSQAVSIGFRIADPGDGSIPTERGFLWSLESIVGVYVNGTRTSPLPGTTAVTVAGRAGGPSNKVFWPSVMFSPPVNLSAFDVVEVTCSFNDTAALTTESEVIFDSPNGTIRCAAKELSSLLLQSWRVLLCDVPPTSEVPLLCDTTGHSRLSAQGQRRFLKILAGQTQRRSSTVRIH